MAAALRGPRRSYRYIYTDFEDGSGSDFFKYDMAMHGPALGVVFSSDARPACPDRDAMLLCRAVEFQGNN